MHNQLLSKVHKTIEVQRTARALHQDRYAPLFNIFEFFEPNGGDEELLSRVIGWMIDPKGTHSQKGKFLAILTTMFGTPWPDEVCDQAEVHLEYRISSSTISGRLDVLVRAKDRLIIIENKPYSADGHNQIKRYFDFIDARAERECRLIYLTSDGSEASNKSIQPSESDKRRASGQFHLMSYRKEAGSSYSLPLWIDQCRLECRADRVSTFLDEFKAFINSRFDGVRDMNETDAVVNDVLMSQDTIEAGFLIANSYDRVRYKLMEKLGDDVQKLCHLRGWLAETELEPERWASIRIVYPGVESMKGTTFCFEFDGSNYQGLIFGIAKRNKEDGAEGVRSTLVENSSIGDGKTSEWWPWYEKASSINNILDTEGDWRTNVTPWQEIHSGRMADKIVNAAGVFHGIMKQKQAARL